jgi:hypothetical protein
MSVMPVTTRDYEARRAPLKPAPTKVNEIKVEETAEMLLYEELAKARIQDLEEGVRAQRQRGAARAARAARRWSRVAHWASQRSHKLQR